MSEEEREKLTKVPLLEHIPLLGALFTNKRTEEVKTEVMIFITPHTLTEESAHEIVKKKN